MTSGAGGRHTKRRLLSAMVLAIVTACSGAATSTTNAVPSTTVAPTTTTPPTTVAPTTSPPTTQPPTTLPSTTTTAAPAPIRTEFLQLTEDVESGTVEVSYPHLIHPDPAIAAAVNDQIDASIRVLIDRFATSAATDGAGDSPSTLVAQAAPELVSDTIFSVSGITTEVFAVSGTGATGRLGWIFDLEDGSLLTAADLFVNADLNPLAEAARLHLIADVLGDDSVITAPGGLTADAANFDAVWLAATGIGVGFDQYQVAAGDIGNPAVHIPFGELAGDLDTSGILEPLQAGSTLPELS